MPNQGQRENCLRHGIGGKGKVGGPNDRSDARDGARRNVDEATAAEAAMKSIEIILRDETGRELRKMFYNVSDVRDFLPEPGAYMLGFKFKGVPNG